MQYGNQPQYGDKQQPPMAMAPPGPMMAPIVQPSQVIIGTPQTAYIAPQVVATPVVAPQVVVQTPQGIEQQYMNFPFGGVRGMGITQLLIGIACILIGIIDVATLKSKVKCDTNAYTEVVCAAVPAWMAIPFVIAGILGICVCRNLIKSIHGIKSGYMVMSILNACIFAPALFIAGCTEAVLNAAWDVLDTDYDYSWTGDTRTIYWGSGSPNSVALPVMIIILSTVEFIIAIVAASMICCRSTPSYGAGLIITQTQPSAVVVTNTTASGFVQPAMQYGNQGYAIAPPPVQYAPAAPPPTQYAAGPPAYPGAGVASP